MAMSKNTNKIGRVIKTLGLLLNEQSDIFGYVKVTGTV